MTAISFDSAQSTPADDGRLSFLLTQTLAFSTLRIKTRSQLSFFYDQHCYRKNSISLTLPLPLLYAQGNMVIELISPTLA
jgi:hypothetical protein